jgi:arylsulfatase
MPAGRTSPRDPSRWIRAFGVRVASWIVLIAAAIDLLAVVIEPWALLRRGAPITGAAAATLAAFGLAFLFSVGAALPIATAYALVRQVGRLPRGWAWLWPAPLVGLAWLVVADVSPHPFERLSPLLSQIAFLGLFSAWLISATLLARWPGGQRRAAAGTALVVTALTISFLLPPSIHGEPRDLLWLCTVVSAAALLYPMRRRLAELSPARSGRIVAILGVASLLSYGVAPWVSPSWRVYAKDSGRFAERLSRFCRAFLDADGDGYSAILGGQDCDDFDERRNPGAAESVDGRDANCNGVTRPASPTPAQHGLTPAFGDPDAPAGAVRRVVLISIDCLRSDVLSPEVTPNLVRLASRGLILTKLYAGGSRTVMSLPLLLRGAWHQTPSAQILEADHVTTTAIFGYRHGSLGDVVFHGFGSVVRPPAVDRRFRASEMTTMALDDLNETASVPHFAWVHYFDAHGPRSFAVLPPDVPRFPPLPREDPESAKYLSELAYVDREVGRLVDGALATVGMEQTVFVITGDHGEAFGRHGVFEHGRSEFEEIIHVPGILLAPGIAPGRYEHVLSHRDIAATIVGSFGRIAAHPEVETFGRSWWRLRAAPDAPLHSFVVTYSTSSHVSTWHDAPMLARTDDRTKLAVSYLEEGERFYHLDSPAGEWRDVDPDDPAEVAPDRRELETYRDIDDPPP